nr:MAG TPA: hypothetical protein [Siphoviridae sp. ctKRf14]
MQASVSGNANVARSQLFTAFTTCRHCVTMLK